MRARSAPGPDMPTDRQLVIFGAGGHGRVVAETAAAMGLTVAGFCDEGKAIGLKINGLPVLAQGLEALAASHPSSAFAVHVALGDNARRLEVAEAARGLGYALPVIRHPAALVSPTASVGEGSVLMAGVIVQANAGIGRCCIVNTAASLDHDNILADGVQVCPGVRSAGDVHYGEGAFVGTGATLIPGIRVGAWAVVGAGAVVARDVPDRARVAGVPARPLVKGT